MSVERRSHFLSEPARELRRLEQSAPVVTKYQDHRTDSLAQSDVSVNDLEGYQDGYSRGMADAHAQAAQSRDADEQRASRAYSALEEAANQFLRASEELRTYFEQRVPELVMTLVAEIVAHEVATLDNPARDALRRALKMSEDATVAHVRMNPQDLALLGDVRDLVGARDITFVADAQIHSGGVVMHTGATTLDGRIDTALQRVRDILEKTRRSGVDDDRAA